LLTGGKKLPPGWSIYNKGMEKSGSEWLGLERIGQERMGLDGKREERFFILYYYSKYFRVII